MPPDGKASLRKGEAQDGEQRRLSCHRGEVSRPQLGRRSWRGRCQARLWSRRPSPSWVPHPLLVDGVHFVTLVLKKPMKMASWASTWGFRRSPEGDPCCHGSLSPARATTPSTSAPNITPERAWSLHLHRHPSASRTAGLATRRQGPGQGRSGQDGRARTVYRDMEQTPEGQERGADVLRSPPTGVITPRWEKPLRPWDRLEPATLAAGVGAQVSRSRGARQGWRERSQAETGRVPRLRAQGGCEQRGAFGSSFPASASDCSWKQAEYKL